METNWSKDELDILKKNYALMKHGELNLLLNKKSPSQIRWKAGDLGIRKKVTKSPADMTFLLNFDDLDVCYWWGFITADGCINKRSIIIAVHEKDLNHLMKFCKLSKSNISKSCRINSWHQEPYTMVRTAIQDERTLPIIKEKLKIVDKKTYNPFDISTFLTKERLACYLAGLIDGDGYIGKYCISIKCHPSWLDNFEKISDKLKEFYSIKSTVKIQNDGWLVLRMSKTSDIVKLYDMIKLNTPYMERKWDKYMEQSKIVNKYPNSIIPQNAV